jgi:hypothetical protein
MASTRPTFTQNIAIHSPRYTASLNSLCRRSWSTFGYLHRWDRIDTRRQFLGFTLVIQEFSKFFAKAAVAHRCFPYYNFMKHTREQHDRKLRRRNHDITGLECRWLLWQVIRGKRSSLFKIRDPSERTGKSQKKYIAESPRRLRT